ncbi:MAG: hypothetical protein JWP89_6897 [Schlesneria sp.]|nr:hypothetical protein [Schlesneria sp.]
MPPTHIRPINFPTARRLRAFSFDPSLSSRLETRVVNERVYPVHWEIDLTPGPVGNYLEVLDFDPASGLWYEPVDLNDPRLLAQDGLPPDASNPQFHQQMVYAVGMTTIRNFERALGRPAVWRTKRKSVAPLPGARKEPAEEEWIPVLRIYPHALREANAYYSPEKIALLFGYFPTGDMTAEGQYPGGMVFTCLSHDVIAHEMTHALLDGVHPRLTEWTQPDGPAFHEAFADIVALFQHFTFREVLQHQIARTRGDLETENLLGALAQEFGRATGTHGALRDALGSVNARTGKWERRIPDPARLASTTEPHLRGAILVAAVFDAFLTIYRTRIADLQRIASGGSGILPAGHLHPDLVARFADEAARSAQHVLTMCIRSIDYIPPVDITFGDFLRALITADQDVYPTDERGYRVAFIDSFRSHGIYPKGLRSLSEQSLVWDSVPEQEQQQDQLSQVIARLRNFLSSVSFITDRQRRWQKAYEERRELWTLLDGFLRTDETTSGGPGRFEQLTGLDFSYEDQAELKYRRLHVYTLSLVQRMDENGGTRNLAVLTLLQRRRHYAIGETHTRQNGVDVWGGCTMIFDLDHYCLRYAVSKNLRADSERLQQIVGMRAAGTSVQSSWDGEPFAMLHRGHGCRS